MQNEKPSYLSLSSLAREFGLPSRSYVTTVIKQHKKDIRTQSPNGKRIYYCALDFERALHKETTPVDIFVRMNPNGNIDSYLGEDTINARKIMHHAVNEFVKLCDSKLL